MKANLVQLFNSAKIILVFISKTAKIDALAAGLALNLAAIQQGKNSKVCSEINLSEANKLIGSDKINKKLDLGGTTLMVSFPYTDGSIDKVTYNITDDRFNLLVEPAIGMSPLEAKNVSFSYTGTDVDLIVCIDTPNLEALGDIYLENPDIFVKEKIVNIDRRFDNKEYGGENIVEKKFSSTSELILKLLEDIRWNINPDIATNLYTGLMTATNNFTSFSTNAQSFEVASYLLKNGARKIPINAKPTIKKNNEFESVNKQAFGLSSQSSPFSSQAPFQGEVQIPVKSNESEKKKPPQDWLKPKIFKSTDLI